MVLNSEKQIAEVSSGGLAVLSRGNSNVIINQCLSYSEVREISRDITKTELEHYSAVSQQEIKKRLTYIEGLLREKFAMTNDGREQRLQQPNAQYSFRNAIIRYIRTGDTYLGNILVELISERLICEERSLIQIATDNAIIDIINITNDQINFLTFLYFISVYNIKSNTLDEFKLIINTVSDGLKNIDNITRYDINNMLSTCLLKDQSTTFRCEHYLRMSLCMKYKDFFEKNGIQMNTHDYSIQNVPFFINMPRFNQYCDRYEEIRKQPVTLLPAGIILGNACLALQFPELPRQEIKF